MRAEKVIMQNHAAILGSSLAVFMALLVSTNASGQSAGDILKPYESLSKLEKRARLVEGAKKEGRFVFYGTLGVDAAAPMLEKFRQAHPYLSIGHYRGNGSGLYNKVVTEARGSKFETDVIEISAGPSAELIRGGFVDPYRSTEIDAVRSEFRDAKNLWHAYQYLVVALAYNKNRVRESDVPKSYQDLLLPRWKGGKMSLDNDDGDIFGALLDSWGEKQALEYFRRLAKQEIVLRNGHTLQAQLLAAGEVDLHPWSHAQRPLLMADRGAPVAIEFLPPVVSKAQGLLLARRAPHPHAAALFIDWALSEEGQTFIGIDLVRSPVRAGAKQKYTVLGTPKTKAITPEFLGRDFEPYTKLYREIFGVK
jgi:iron(III) transport system substrate-binding protein